MGFRPTHGQPEVVTDVTPFAAPVLMRADGGSGRFPLLENFQGRTSLES